ncbi:pyridoxal phosphate-dependent transferase [Mycena capillaripes]|nr:pyridoxal phosphate-dependent transferase [Mycena capillaripes]
MPLEPSPARGCPIPPNSPHTVCNSLPEWEDNIANAINMGKGDEIFKGTSYPRFNIHPFVKQLTAIIVNALEAGETRNCLLFATSILAENCRSFVKTHFPSSFCDVHCATDICHPPPGHQVFAVLFSAERKPVMNFYTFSGSGISPRLAELCLLRRAGDLRPTLSLPLEGSYFGGYYQRHSPLSSAEDAKKAIRHRFSGMVDGSENIRGVPGASPDDVYLFGSGMQAIWRSHKLLAGTVGSRDGSEPRKVAHVNLLFADSYRFLELSSSAGYHFFTNETIDELETLLETGTPDRPAILSVYTDFPGNPHLRSPDILRLRALADHFKFPIIVDETVGGYLNCQVFPYCDVVVSSLTKLFSGQANVLCGAVMLNPASRFYPEFKAHMDATYSDSFFDDDALVLEINSREYVDRTVITNYNAEKLADMLYARSVLGGAKGSIVQAVHYPKYRTRENFERCRNPLAGNAGLAATGYGCMLAVTFTSLTAAKAFYSALQCYKGATLGTGFTLATAFSVLAYAPDQMHLLEARGVEETLIRFSVGIEDTSSILKCISDALSVAESRVKTGERNGF